jgi:hypothetical protein
MDFPISRSTLQSLKALNEARQRFKRMQSAISDISNMIVSTATAGDTVCSYSFGDTEIDGIFLRYSLDTIIRNLTERFPDTEIIPAKVTWHEYGKMTYEKYPKTDFTYINGLVIDWS